MTDLSGTEEYERISDLAKHFGFRLVPFTQEISTKLKARIVDSDNDKVIELNFAKFLSGEVHIYNENEHFKLSETEIFDTLFDYEKPVLVEGD